MKRIVTTTRRFSNIAAAGALLWCATAAVSAQPSMMMGMGDHDMMGPGWGMMQGPMGMGMMGPGMMGEGMMGYGGEHMMGGLWMLDLSKEQREKIRAILREQRSKTFDLADQRMAIWDELAEVHREDKPDPKKTAAVYGKLFAIKQQMIEQAIDTRNKVYDVLTEEQREKLGSSYSGRYSHGGMGHHMMRK